MDVVERIIRGSLSGGKVVDWLTTAHSTDPILQTSDRLSFSRYLMNYLREATSCILEANSLSVSPIKAAVSVKKDMRRHTCSTKSKSTSNYSRRNQSRNFYLQDFVADVKPFKSTSVPKQKSGRSKRMNFSLNDSNEFPSIACSDNSSLSPYSPQKTASTHAVSFSDKVRGEPANQQKIIDHNFQNSSNKESKEMRYISNDELSVECKKSTGNSSSLSNQMSRKLNFDDSSSGYNITNNNKSIDLLSPSAGTAISSFNSVVDYPFLSNNIDNVTHNLVISPNSSKNAAVKPKRRIKPIAVDLTPQIMNIANSCDQPLDNISASLNITSKNVTEHPLETKGNKVSENQSSEKTLTVKVGEKTPQNKFMAWSPRESSTPLTISESDKILMQQQYFKTPQSVSVHNEISSNCSNEVHAELCKVSSFESLLSLANTYATLIKCGLIPNITQEMFFLIQLLTVHVVQHDSIEWHSESAENPFSSLHNVVFFSVQILSQIVSFFVFLDRGTIRLLAENSRIEAFNPSFSQSLGELLDDIPIPIFSVPNSPAGVISFHEETDNRSNFPNDRSFHQFRRQRDMFYRMLGDWQAQHLNSNWNMVQEQQLLVHELLSYSEPTNHYHLARLFLDLLLQSLVSSKDKEADGEAQISLLGTLKLNYPEKFKRLRERLTTPSQGGGPCPTPSFPGDQQFFYDFIVIADSQFFCSLLKIVILDKIFKILDGNYSLLNCILPTRVLARFLGFVTFRPLLSSHPFPESVESAIVRSHHCNSDPLDILLRLKEAVEQHTLLRTLPWVTEYLAMADAISLSLPVYNELLEWLKNIYAVAWRHLSTSNFVIICLLGWLFQQPNFPGDIIDANVNVQFAEAFSLSVDSEADVRVLYTCCPYLASLRLPLLTSTSVSVSRRLIPQLATTMDTTPRKMKQMHTAFFDKHPSLVRRTVELVADKVSTEYIADIKKEHMKLILSQTDQSKDLLWSYAGKCNPQERCSEILGYVLPRDISEAVKKTSSLLCSHLVIRSISNLLKRMESSEICHGVSNSPQSEEGLFDKSADILISLKEVCRCVLLESESIQNSEVEEVLIAIANLKQLSSGVMRTLGRSLVQMCLMIAICCPRLWPIVDKYLPAPIKLTQPESIPIVCPWTKFMLGLFKENKTERLSCLREAIVFLFKTQVLSEMLYQAEISKLDEWQTLQ